MINKSFYLDHPYKIYFEEIIPDKVTKKSVILMIPGASHTINCYKITPDERIGWAYFFAKEGFKVCLADWPGIGKSGHIPLEKIDGKFLVRSFSYLIKRINKKIILFSHSMSGALSWKLGELMGNKISHIIAVAPAPMGNIQPKPKFIKRGRYYILETHSGIIKINLEEPFVNSNEFVIKKLIGNSKFFPRQYIKQYISSLQPTPPHLVFERFNIKGSQLKINNFSKYRKVKILVVTGTEDFDHPKETDKSIVEYFQKHQVKAEFCWLGDKGIKGNGHMLILEKNNLRIADLIFKWIMSNKI